MILDSGRPEGVVLQMVFGFKRTPAQNPSVARFTRSFFRTKPERHVSLSEVARDYAMHLYEWHSNPLGLRTSPFSTAGCRFNIGFMGEPGDRSDLTKRGVLVSDTLLLSDVNGRTVRHAGTYNRFADPTSDISEEPSRHWTDVYIGCDDLADLGQWILDCRDLLRQGLLAYLPAYLTSDYRARGSFWTTEWQEPIRESEIVTYLVRDRIATVLGAEDPIVSQLVHPILRIELPYVDGVNMRDFSRITVDELNSYQAFRDFLRGRFLDLDTAVCSEQMDRDLVKIGLEIADGIREIRSGLTEIKKRRSVAMTGATTGTVAAVLAAVYGPALVDAASVLGAGGGLWKVIESLAESRVKRSQVADGPWYYVWTLERRSSRI
ncbi:hypothetical protein [Micromonospora sp. CPCC 206061]|uniref:hypothetical protein n=1 Tax=Micromonospora sp. CPCC 206061 TaxID=3122410 RepID=UPI002FF2E5B2